MSDEELAFYDAIVGVGARVYDQPFLCDLVREVVQAVRHNLKVDWTKPHRDSVKAGVQSAVKMVLRRKGGEGRPVRLHPEPRDGAGGGTVLRVADGRVTDQRLRHAQRRK